MMGEEGELEIVSRLQRTERFINTIRKVEIPLHGGSNPPDHATTTLEEDPDYNLVVDCNALFAEIEDEIGVVHNFIRDRYRQRFPDLESLVQHPIDYARVVRKIGNWTAAPVDLSGFLPSAVIMAVSMTDSITSGKELEESVLQRTIEACDIALALDEAKSRVLEFVESRMWRIAPNLSSVVGSFVAAQLMGTAGGLAPLAMVPACNVLLLGGSKRHIPSLAGFSSRSRVGCIANVDILHSTPPALHGRASRLLASKAALAARIDCTNADPSGGAGATLRRDICKNIGKWQEPPPARRSKPLPVPYSEPRKKRAVAAPGR